MVPEVLIILGTDASGKDYMANLNQEMTKRQGRISRRNKCGKMDCFDRYMLEDSRRSERIEDFLDWLGMTYLGAAMVKSDDRHPEELADRLRHAFSRLFQQALLRRESVAADMK